tara:strand:- start:44427 stop:45509 length:1083 start_codon:yes stop_codon:yes gene_type:complete
MRLIPKIFTKVSNAIYKGFSGEVVSLPSVGLAIHDGINFGGVLIQPQSATAFANRDNFVRNSNFRSIQNGSLFIGNSAPATYTIDGWFMLHNGGSTSNIAQLSGYDVETNSMTRARVTTFSGGLSSSYSIFAQTYHNLARFAGKKMTLSYWIKPTLDTSITNEMRLTFADAGTVDRGVLVGRQSLKANVWNRVESTFSVPAIGASDIINNNTDNARILYWLDAGDDWNSRTGGILPFSGTFDIANVKLDGNNRATEYDASDIIYENQKVQEYYEKNTRIHYLPNLGTLQSDPLTTKVFGELAFANAKWTNLPMITYTLSNANTGILQGRDSGGFTIQATATSDTLGASITTYTGDAEIIP